MPNIKKYGKLGIICHRGLISNFPENTLSSIKGCSDFSSDGCEVDIQLTKDNQIIVLHDRTLERTSIGIIPDYFLKEEEYKKIITTDIYDLTYEEICKINIGTNRNPECAPLLEDILLLKISDPKFKLLIEISGKTNGKISDLKIIKPLEKLLKKIKEKHYLVFEQIKLISFGIDVFKKLNKVNFFNNFEKYWILESKNFIYENRKKSIENINKLIDILNKEKLTGFNLEVNISNKFIDYIKYIKNKNFKIIIWVPVDSEIDGNETANLLQKLGIDYFTSNIPDSLITD